MKSGKILLESRKACKNNKIESIPWSLKERKLKKKRVNPERLPKQNLQGILSTYVRSDTIIPK